VPHAKAGPPRVRRQVPNDARRRTHAGPCWPHPAGGNCPLAGSVRRTGVCVSRPSTRPSTSRQAPTRACTQGRTCWGSVSTAADHVRFRVFEFCHFQRLRNITRARRPHLLRLDEHAGRRLRGAPAGGHKAGDDDRAEQLPAHACARMCRLCSRACRLRAHARAGLRAHARAGCARTHALARALAQQSCLTHFRWRPSSPPRRPPCPSRPSAPYSQCRTHPGGSHPQGASRPNGLPAQTGFPPKGFPPKGLPPKGLPPKGPTSASG
jgi:hypothetical protein